MQIIENEVNAALDSVRKKTDTSLATERTKTDESLLEVQTAAETQSDVSVAKQRIKSDQEQNAERKLSDEKKALSRASSDSSSLENEREIADANLEEERNANDLAQKNERAKTDAAITKERRSIKLAAEALFVLERGNTDADLLNEREHVDTEADAHKETRELMSVMSRDLKEPLNSILKLGEMLQASLVTEKVVSPQIHRLLGIIRRNSSEVEKMVADMLDLESLNEGTLSLNLSLDDMGEVLAECSEIFNVVAKAKNIEFSTNCGKKPLVSTFDRDRILQVLSNLIQHGLNRVQNNGSIEIGAAATRTHVEISVADNGKEISASEQLEMFNKFSDSTHKGKKDLHQKNLNLGLHVSKGIIEAHGGEITFESTADNGNTFLFTLPLDRI